MKRAGRQTCPASLVASAQSGAVVTVEVLVKQDIVPPMRILLKLRGSPVDRPASASVAEEDVRQPPREFLRHFEQRQVMLRTRGTLHLKFVAIKLIQIQKRPDEQDVNWHPDRSAPVGVPTEHARV